MKITINRIDEISSSAVTSKIDSFFSVKKKNNVWAGLSVTKDTIDEIIVKVRKKYK